MLLIANTDHLDADLASGRLACSCGGRLTSWGHATGRRIRLLAEATAWPRPRRARGTRCRTTHVLLPAWCLPRRSDAAEVIGAALVAKAAGHGHRFIAAQLGRPAATVRGWLRRADDHHARSLYEQAVTHAARLDADVLNQVQPADTVLGDALSALAAVVAAWRRHQLRALPTWTLLVMFTGGRLLSPSRDDQHVSFEGRVCPQ